MKEFERFKKLASEGLNKSFSLKHGEKNQNCSNPTNFTCQLILDD